MAEIQAILLIEFDEVRVDLCKAEVWKGEELQQLSAKEFGLLKYFLEHRGETLSRPELLRERLGVCGDNPDAYRGRACVVAAAKDRG
jgi:DNA-binding response OmpR family regulator